MRRLEMSSLITTIISLSIISIMLIVLGYFSGEMPKTENFALAFAVYASIRANEEK